MQKNKFIISENQLDRVLYNIVSNRRDLGSVVSPLNENLAELKTTVAQELGEMKIVEDELSPLNNIGRKAQTSMDIVKAPADVVAATTQSDPGKGFGLQVIAESTEADSRERFQDDLIEVKSVFI